MSNSRVYRHKAQTLGKRNWWLADLRSVLHGKRFGLLHSALEAIGYTSVAVEATGEAHFCAPAFSYVLRTKTGTFFITLFSPISIALRPSRPASRPASKLAPKCFVLIPMVSRRWSSRLALRPASNYTSSSKLFVWLQFPYP